MQNERNMYGVQPSIDDQMHALPTLTAHRVWKQAGTPVMSAICEAAGVSYMRFTLVRIGKKNLSYPLARCLQYGIFMALGVVVNLDTLCNAIAYREHQDAEEQRAFDAAKVSA
jgi:hypothetical protein